MSAVTALRGPQPALISAQSNADLWVMLGHCDGTVSRLEDELDQHSVKSPRYDALTAQLTAWRAEQDKIETELKDRFLSWCGGVDLNSFVERLG